MFTNCKVSFTYNGKFRLGVVKAEKMIGDRRLLIVNLSNGENRSFYMDKCEGFDYMESTNKRGYTGTGEAYDSWKDRLLVNR